MSHPPKILLVEDNPDDEELTVHALRMRTTANVEVAHDGEEALDHLFNDAKDMPQLVLLDLKLPNIDGLEVLRRIRADERTCLTPVVILTSSDAPIDVAAGYRHGANSYVRKPVDFDQFSEAVHQLGLYWLATNEPPPNVRDQPPRVPGFGVSSPPRSPPRR
jgi:two-component system, response regulator